MDDKWPAEKLRDDRREDIGGVRSVLRLESCVCVRERGRDVEEKWQDKGDRDTRLTMVLVSDKNLAV